MKTAIQFISVVTVLFVWAVLSLAAGKMIEIPWEILVVMFALFGKNAAEFVGALKGQKP